MRKRTEKAHSQRDGEREPPPIIVRNLSKAFGGRRVVDDLSFEVQRGRVTGFLGPNGAGKTTTMRMLLGLASADGGTAMILGKSYVELSDPARVVGVLLDPATMHPRRNARSHLRWMAVAAGIERSRIDEVLEQVDLHSAADRRVGEFSLGMRQRLGLAGALLGQPRVLVLDEPANGLDPAGIKWLRQFLQDFAHGGGAVLVSSHLLAEVAQLADDVVVISQGRLITQTSVDQLTSGTTTRARTPEPERLAGALGREGLDVRAQPDGSLEIRGVGPERVGEVAASEGVVLHELARAAHSLEDVFFALTSTGAER